MTWKHKLIVVNLKTNKTGHIINLIALSLGVIIFSLFGGFFLSQREMIYEQSKLFPEYLTANIEKSEMIDSDSKYLKLKQVSRPTRGEVISFLDHGINARIHLNYTNLFMSGEYSIFEKKLPPILPVFLYDFSFDSVQSKMLDNVRTVRDRYDLVYVNSSFINEMTKIVNIDKYNDISIRYSLVIEDEKVIYNKQFNIEIAGVFDELSYLTTPKIYFSQTKIDDFFLRETLSDGKSVFNYLTELNSTDAKTSFSYRLYMYSLADIERAKLISNSLKDDQSYLNISSEHLSRVESLSEMFEFTSIIIGISVVLIIISLLFINITITHLELKKANAKIALLYFFKAKTSEILDIYLGQNLILVSLSMLSLLAVPLLVKRINFLLMDILYIRSGIEVPLLVFLDVPLLFPLIIFGIMYLSASLITIFNIFIKNQKSLIKRLAHND